MAAIPVGAVTATLYLTPWPRYFAFAHLMICLVTTDFPVPGQDLSLAHRVGGNWTNRLAQ